MKKLSSIAISFSLVVLFVSVMGVSTSKKVFASSPLGATNLSAAETYTEDTPLNLIDIVVTDGSSPNVTAALTVSNTSAGTLSTMTSAVPLRIKFNSFAAFLDKSINRLEVFGSRSLIFT